ncbi:DoxX family protein [Nocardia brasiliensis]|uniref:DoxX family protein n=1 Tax=Nocardia brasiliensis TaxID=37326 RepID=UPI002458B4A1|nr:DoxX family protein [Nocardia brasiliensis]
MHAAYVIVTILAAAWVGFSAASIFFRAAWVVDPLVQYGVPQAWWTWLGIAKAAGAVGLVAGLFFPVIGIAATIGIVLYFGGAVITNINARAYAHIPFPLMYMIPALIAAGLGAAV